MCLLKTSLVIVVIYSHVHTLIVSHAPGSVDAYMCPSYVGVYSADIPRGKLRFPQLDCIFPCVDVCAYLSTETVSWHEKNVEWVMGNLVMELGDRRRSRGSQMGIDADIVESEPSLLASAEIFPILRSIVYRMVRAVGITGNRRTEQPP